jgi:hypothetical protein
VGAPAEEAAEGTTSDTGAPTTGSPTPAQPLEESTGTGPSTSGPTDGPTVVDPSNRHADDTEKVRDTSEGSEPRDSNE